MNEPFNEKRFKNVLTVSRILTIIIVSIIIFMGVLALIGTIFGMFISPTWIEFDLSQHALLFDRGPIAFSIDSLEGILSLKTILVFGGLALIVVTGFGLMFFNNLRLLLREVKEKRPFSSTSVKHVMYMSYTLILAGIIIPIFASVFFRQIMLAVESPELSINYSPDINTIFLGLLLYLLGKIFAYGNYLQAEVDGTV